MLILRVMLASVWILIFCYNVPFTTNIVAISDMSSRRSKRVNFAMNKDIFSKAWENWLENDRFGIDFSLFIFFRSCISKFVSDTLRIHNVKWFMRNAKYKNDEEKRHGTRDSASHESIREKSRVGQLTRRRAISGSEWGIKGAWELERIGGIVEKGRYEKWRDLLLRVCRLAACAQHLC